MIANWLVMITQHHVGQMLTNSFVNSMLPTVGLKLGICWPNSVKCVHDLAYCSISWLYSNSIVLAELYNHVEVHACRPSWYDFFIPIIMHEPWSYLCNFLFLSYTRHIILWHCSQCRSILPISTVSKVTK